jgi:DNA-directed RNA polymerase specialized sigma24 family protein
VAKAAGGDAESWAAITGRFTPLLWAIARSHQRNKDDSADVVEITWLRLLENFDGSTTRRHCRAG